MRRSLVLFAIVSLFTLAYGSRSSAAQPFTAPSPAPITSPAGTLGADSRFGIDYVYPLQATYRQEKWPQLFAQTGAGWVNFADVSWEAIEPNPPDDQGNHTYKWRKLDRAVKVWQKYGFHITVSLRLGKGWFAGPIKYRPAGIKIKGSDRLPAEEYMGVHHPHHYRWCLRDAVPGGRSGWHRGGAQRGAGAPAGGMTKCTPFA